MPQKQALVSYKNLQIQVTWKKIKYLRLRVCPPDGLVKVSAPTHINKQTIEAFVTAQLKWIKKHQDKYLSQPEQPIINFASGEVHYLFGKPYSLKVEEIVTKRNCYKQVELSGSYFKLFINSGCSKQQREKLLYDYYRSEIKKIIPDLISKWEPIIGKQVSQWNVRKMKTRWGSCNIKAKRIWLNLELAKKPPECLEYVVVHEMIHLLERYHNQRFYQFMDQFLPNWKIIRKKLNA